MGSPADSSPTDDAPAGENRDTLVAHWPRVRAVLDEALELPASARQAFVDAQSFADAQGNESALRAHLRSILLAYDDTSTDIESPWIGSDTAAKRSYDHGTRIGAYRILEPIGEGGMGTVYLAARDDDAYDRQVAIKVLRSVGHNPELIDRFRRERQILADLEHPNIAQLLDGGTTDDGTPYLVMERIEGVPIDAYCDDQGLGVEARLQLFHTVCEAVQFAHQSLIVHRDLKPSNLLVTVEGTPKLLDFGIAKILAPDDFAQTVARTRTGLAPMTLRYASPEQVRGKHITASSDVYSLGILLFELIVGRAPYRVDDGDLNGLLTAICEQDLETPSRALAATSKPRFRRDLLRDIDAIVLQATAKDPARRYPTAAHLGDDIARVFARRPVHARRPTWRYRTAKLVRRHRLALSAAATVFAVLVASIVVLAFQQQRLIEQRDTAIREQQTSTTVTGWLTELFALPDPGRAMGERVTARSLLDRSRDALAVRTIDEPLLAAALFGTLGETYQNLGLLREARASLTRSIDLYRAAPEDTTPQLSQRLRQLARVAAAEGRYREARQIAREALAHARRIPASPAADVPQPSLGTLERVRNMAFLAHVETLLGAHDDARRRFATAVPAARRAGDEETLARTLEYTAELHQVTDEWDQAEGRYQEALAVRRAFQGPDHPDVALIESSLALVVSRLRPDEAEAMFRDAIARQRAVLGEQHPIVATALNNFAFWLAGEGRDDEAEDLYAQSLAMKRAVYGDAHPKIAATLQNLGSRASRRRGELDRALTLIDQALELYRQELGEQHPDFALCLANKGRIQLIASRFEAAEATLRQALDLLDASLGPGHSKSASVLLNLGETLRRQGDLESARTLFARAVDAAGREGGSDRLETTARFNLATTAFQLGDHAAAAPLFASVVDDADVGVFARTRLAASALEIGDLDATVAHAQRALEGWQARGDDLPWWRLSAERSLALALLGGGDVQAATTRLKSRMAEVESIFPDNDAVLDEARQDLEALAAIRDAATDTGARP